MWELVDIAQTVGTRRTASGGVMRMDDLAVGPDLIESYSSERPANKETLREAGGVAHVRYAYVY